MCSSIHALAACYSVPVFCYLKREKIWNKSAVVLINSAVDRSLDLEPHARASLDEQPLTPQPRSQVAVTGAAGRLAA
jgi:hypothetical protein